MSQLTWISQAHLAQNNLTVLIESKLNSHFFFFIVLYLMLEGVILEIFHGITVKPRPKSGFGNSFGQQFTYLD